MMLISIEDIVKKNNEVTEENKVIIDKFQESYINYIKLLDVQSKTLMITKCEIFNPLVKSRMINTH